MTLLKRLVLVFTLLFLSSQTYASYIKKLDFSAIVVEEGALIKKTQPSKVVEEVKGFSYDHEFDFTPEGIKKDLPQALAYLRESLPYTFDDPVTGKRMQGVVFQSMPDGDCGYTSMFLVRSTAIDETLQMKENMFVRSLVNKIYMDDKAGFERYVKAARNDHFNYLRMETNLRYDRESQGKKFSRLNLPVQDDLIGAVSFTNDRHVVGLLHDESQESPSLMPCYISKSFMNPASRLVYVLFEGEGVHGNAGIHYNIVIPIEKPDSISQAQYNENLVVAWRAHQKTVAYMEDEARRVKLDQQRLLDLYGKEDALVRKDYAKKSDDLINAEMESLYAELIADGMTREEIDALVAAQ